MLAIFDMSVVNIERYNSELLKRHVDEFIAYVDDPDCCEGMSCSNARLICTAGWPIQKIINSFRELKVSNVIISGQRPADFRIIIAANNLHIPIVYKMHGLYVENVKRNISFYLLSFKKELRTDGYLIDIGCFTNSIKLPFGILLSFVVGMSRKYWMKSHFLQVDHGLVWSKYWQIWHEKNWFMTPNKRWEVTGNPDTLKFSKVELNSNNICYIYQTLVEDGRVTFHDMNDFYDGLATVAGKMNFKVNVKWHARGDATIKKSLEARGFIVHNNFPLTTLYVGHFSSLLGMVPLVEGKIIIYELDGHDTPEPIRQCATSIAHNIPELERSLNLGSEARESKNKQAEYYFGSDYSTTIEYEVIKSYLNG